MHQLERAGNSSSDRVACCVIARVETTPSDLVDVEDNPDFKLHQGNRSNIVSRRETEEQQGCLWYLKF